LLAAEIFYVIDGKKRSIPNWDTFVEMKFKQGDIVKIGIAIDDIPTGIPIPPV
jgi:hypothetical protein